MYKKSFSDLSTTLLSVKDSMGGKTNEFDNEQIEISAIITSYSIEEDSNKLFSKNYILFEIKLCTPYKSWSTHKRYSQFEQLRKNLESKNIKTLPELPPKLLFINEQKLNERQLGLEEFLNKLFRNINILKYQIIIDFIECPQDVVDIFKNNMDYLNSTNMNSTNVNSSIYYNGRISTNKKSVYNYDNINIKNPYSSMVKLKFNNNVKESLDNDDSFEEEISPGTLVVQEFLRNLMDSSYNKTELLFQFEFFLKNKKNEAIKANLTNNNWFYLDANEIEIFFDGFYSNISHIKINGFLYHCGNIQNNKIGTQKCLEFLNKILSEDFNPQADLFLKIFRKTQLENIIQMELENHIINNFNSNRLNAFMILYKYIGGGKNIKNKIKRILMCQKAETLYLNWYNKTYQH
jgi:hypothetical protein